MADAGGAFAVFMKYAYYYDGKEWWSYIDHLEYERVVNDLDDINDYIISSKIADYFDPMVKRRLNFL